MEAHHQRLVLGPDRAYRHGRAVAQRFVGDVLRRVGTDRRFAEGPRPRRLGVVQDDAGVEGDQALGRGQERVDVELLDPGLLDDELAEAHEQPLQRPDVDRRPPLTPPSASKIGSAPSSAGERGGQRREGEGPVPVHLDQRAAGAEEQDGPELRVQAAADDQLVAVEADHLLDGGAVKSSAAV